MKIDPLFQVHKLNPVGMKNAEVIGALFSHFLFEIEENCGTEGREISIVRTKLQEAAFFAKRAMAMRTENQL